MLAYSHLQNFILNSQYFIHVKSFLTLAYSHIHNFIRNCTYYIILFFNKYISSCLLFHTYQIWILISPRFFFFLTNHSCFYAITPHTYSHLQIFSYLFYFNLFYKCKIVPHACFFTPIEFYSQLYLVLYIFFIFFM